MISMDGSEGTAAGKHFLSGMVHEVRRELALGYYDYMPSPSLMLSLARPSLSSALARPGSRPALMLELKHASPGYSDARLPDVDAEWFVALASQVGAEALSVIPQPEAFGGSLEEFTEVARRSPLPILFKDFIVSVEQLEAARACGASAVLLLARLARVGDLELPLSEMVREAHRLGMETVIEVHGAEELADAWAAGPDVLGVNARDLESLRVDVAGAIDVLQGIHPGNIPLLAMSGVEGPRTVEFYVRAGATGILVGTAFLRNDDPEGFARSLRVGEGPR